MPTIGVADVLIRPSFKGLQQNVGRELDGAADSAGEKAGKSAGTKMGGALGSALKVGALGVAGVAVAGLGVALTKGFGRLQAIENAKASLVGLGHSAETVKGIMDNALSAVRGTAFGLDEAATVAANAVAAGVKPGKDLERTLKLTGDAATIAGVGMEEMGSIFGKVASSNKIQGDVIAQLSDNGIPIVSLLAKELGKTAEETVKLASAGKINFATFQNAMEKGLGGAAQASGKTLEGAVSNTMAAVGRIGASLLSGVYPRIQQFFAGAIEWLKPFEDSAKVIGAQVGDFLTKAIDKGVEFANYFKSDVIPAIQEFGKWVVDNKDWLLSLTAAVVGGTLAYQGFLIVNKVTAAIKAFSLATTIAAAKQWLLNLAMSANPIGLIVVAIAALVAGLVYFFTQTELGKQIVANVWSFIQTVVGGVVTWFQTVVLPVILTVFNAVGAVFTWLYENIIKPVWDGIMVVVNAAWLVIRGVFQLLASIIQNVIAPVFVWLYNTIIKPTFDAIGAAIGWVWNNILKPIFDTWVWIFRNVIGPAFNWLYQNVIKPAFDGIGKAIKWVWDNVLKPVFDFLSNAIQKDIPKAFDTGVAAVKKVWETIQDIAKAPVRFVVDTVINDGLIGAFNTIAGILPGIDKLPRVALPPGFMNGGYTGNGGKDEPAGIVHGGEFVFTKEQTRKAGVRNLYAMADALAGYRDGGFVNPLKSLALTQGYNRIHKGVDFAAGVGTPVFATENGRVSWSGPGVRSGNVWGGNEIHIDGRSGIQEWFAHLSSMAVRVGDMVRAGQQIGLSGNTGITSGPHLHFGTFQGGWPNDVNPLGILSGAGVPSGGGFNPLAGIIDGLLGQFRSAFPMGGFIADMAIGVGKKLFGTISDLITGGQGSAAGPALYDLGGILPPGVSQVVNRTGKPEAILNPQQWSDISRLAQQGGGRGDVIIKGNVGWDPHEVADRIDTKRRDTFAAFGI